MKLQELLEASMIQKIKRQVIDALALIKINDVTEVPTDSVIDELATKGIYVSKEELVDMLSDSEIVADITDDVVRFEEDTELDSSEEDLEISSSNKVSQLADKALNKRM